MEDKLKQAIPYLDLLFPEFPEYDDFDLYKFIPSTKLSKEEKQQAHKRKSEIEILMVDKFQYAERNNVLSIHLNEKGRKAQFQGGHAAYLNYLQSEATFNQRKEFVDLKTKEFVYKSRYYPHIVATLALIISCLTYIKSCKHDTERRKKPQGQQLQLPKTTPTTDTQAQYP